MSGGINKNNLNSVNSACKQCKQCSVVCSIVLTHLINNGTLMKMAAVMMALRKGMGKEWVWEASEEERGGVAGTSRLQTCWSVQCPVHIINSSTRRVLTQYQRNDVYSRVIPDGICTSQHAKCSMGKCQ